jgi:hypothetical protein
MSQTLLQGVDDPWRNAGGAHVHLHPPGGGRTFNTREFSRLPVLQRTHQLIPP